MSSEPEPTPDAAAAPAKPAKPSKLIIPLLVLNLGGTGFAVFKLLTASPAAHAAAPAHVVEIKDEKTGPIVAFDPFVVNLNEAGQPRYLKCNVKLEVQTVEVQHTIEKKLILIRDMILSKLSGLSVAESLGAAAKDKIKSELKAGIQELVGEDTVKRVFFDEFVVQ